MTISPAIGCGQDPPETLSVPAGWAADVPGPLASHRLTGPAADDVLSAIQAAPADGGPDAPHQWSADSSGAMALVLRLIAGGRGNGFDDRTTVRELTPGLTPDRRQTADASTRSRVSCRCRSESAVKTTSATQMTA